MIFSVILLVLVIRTNLIDSIEISTHDEVLESVRYWAKKIGKELHSMSLAMSRKEKVEQVIRVHFETYFNIPKQSFRPLQNKIYNEEGPILIQSIASDLRVLMEKKAASVKRIAEYAEFLAYHRHTNSDPGYWKKYNYYDADYLEMSTRKNHHLDLATDILQAECEWWCNQKDVHPLPNNMFNKKNLSKLFELKNNKQEITHEECDCDKPPLRRRPKDYFATLPMEYDSKYDTEVNYNLSVVKTPANIHNRTREVLEGVRWSEPLDLVFKENLRDDPTLGYQYFASPVGYMRQYPAQKWSQENYDRTYDFRTRSWYTEAMTSPKDMLILVDRSGSTSGVQARIISHTVNNILDTLNDNDFVNIYTFANSTTPLVECFSDTLVQANEENLRLLRENLNVYPIDYAADITVGLKKAYEILRKFRKTRSASGCNQAIMLITNDLDYTYDTEIFAKLNGASEGVPVRLFTYELGTEEQDSEQLEWMACANRGYFVNVSHLGEIREKVLNYMNVMSRPVNLEPMAKQTQIWSYLQIDLADRRYTNWLWRKFEGNRQRMVFLDHAKRQYQRLRLMLTSNDYMLLQDTHEYAEYQNDKKDSYLTTVSMPVYGRRKEDYNLIGVAAVDVPIMQLHALIPHHKLGVNGYAFIITNNGYILMHPDHRREFEDIPKPTFNRVDLLETEIMDDLSEPRLFGQRITELRDKMVQQEGNDSNGYLKVKFALDDMRRIILTKRRYYYAPIGPFTIAIALPDRYGLMVVNNSHLDAKQRREYPNSLRDTKYWRVHPHWTYCVDTEGETPEKIVLKCMNNPTKSTALLNSLLFDAEATKWFDQFDDDVVVNIMAKYMVSRIFIATHSGLTRTRTFKINNVEDDRSFLTKNSRAIDEDWYRRAAEENFRTENMFIYSIPFEISGYENNTMITSTNAIFVKDSTRRIPVAVVGVRFNHRAMKEIYSEITTKCPGKNCQITCESDSLTCFILDNNAYIVQADEIEYTGRYFGDIKPDIMYHLVRNGVYKSTRMFDYQAICQKQPPESRKSRSSASTIFKFRTYLNNLFQITNWALATILMFLRTISAGPDYQSKKEETLAFERLELKKTLPTPCDQEMWLFTLNDHFNSSLRSNTTLKFECEWPYILEKIPYSNLLFLAVNTNKRCKVDTTHTYHKSPTPIEIEYNTSLPCYIGTKNNFTRRVYMNCYKNHPIDDGLNARNHTFCGHTWRPWKDG